MKKALSIIKTILVWLVVLAAVSMVIFTVLSVTVFDRNDRDLFGIKPYIDFIKTTPGYFICIFIPFMLIIIYEGVRLFNLFRRYKKEQLEEMLAEKAKIEAEKAENAKMLEELKALKAQLEGDRTLVNIAAQATDTTEETE